MADKRGDRAGRDGGEKPRHRMGGRYGARGDRAEKMMARADANGDKAISRDEFRTASLAMFTRADANKDGVVTAAEKQAAGAKMRERMGEGRRGGRGGPGPMGDMPPPPGNE